MEAGPFLSAAPGPLPHPKPPLQSLLRAGSEQSRLQGLVKSTELPLCSGPARGHELPAYFRQMPASLMVSLMRQRSGRRGRVRQVAEGKAI